MKKIALSLILGGIILSSCSTKMYTTRTATIDRQSIPSTPLIAEVKADVKTKVTGEATTKGRSASVSMAKELATYDAMQKSGADFIVDPIYEIKVKGNKAVAKVTGYKGTYVEIRKPTEDDMNNMAKFKEVTSTRGEKDGMAGKGKGFKKKKKQSKSDQKTKSIMNN